MEETLDGSPADETELVWIECRRRRVANRESAAPTLFPRQRSILVRVIDRGRLGTHRTGAGDPGTLENAVREAIAQSRIHKPLPGLPHLPADSTALILTHLLHDPHLAGLDPAAARDLLNRTARRRERAELEWLEAHVAVFNNRAVRRKTSITAASLEVRCGRRPGGGRAAGAARTLAALPLEEIFERARRRHARGGVDELPATPVPIVLSPEAAAELCELLARVAFSARSYQEGTSFLRDHLGVQVFDRSFNLRDDGTDPHGLAFPFDLEGTAKRPVDLIVQGIPKTPALDQRQAAVLGLPATGHAVGGNDAMAENIFLLPGEQPESELLRKADGGIWIGWIDHAECFDPKRVMVRVRARGVRSIAGAALGGGLPDLVWEDSLLRAFSSLLGIGDAPTSRLGTSLLGGTSAAAVALGDVANLSQL